MPSGAGRSGLDGWRRVIDSDADVILIACASKFHPMYTLAALKAGKHVFCEKPLSLYIREGRALVRAARKYNRVVQTGTH